MMKRTGSKVVIDALADAGVTTVFGYPGGAIMPFYDALLDSPLEHVLVRHEQSAVYAADGYARAIGRPGIALVTTGPGAAQQNAPVGCRLNEFDEGGSRGLALLPTPAPSEA